MITIDAEFRELGTSQCKNKLQTNHKQKFCALLAEYPTFKEAINSKVFDK